MIPLCTKLKDTDQYMHNSSLREQFSYCKNIRTILHGQAQPLQYPQFPVCIQHNSQGGKISQQ